MAAGGSAVQAAGLVDTLKGEGPFTVFAPTDEAFAKLPAGTVDSLLLPENKDKLKAVLTYHVVSGKVLAADVVSLTTATTVQGADVTINADGSFEYDPTDVPDDPLLVVDEVVTTLVVGDGGSACYCGHGDPCGQDKGARSKNRIHLGTDRREKKRLPPKAPL